VQLRAKRSYSGNKGGKPRCYLPAGMGADRGPPPYIRSYSRQVTFYPPRQKSRSSSSFRFQVIDIVAHELPFVQTKKLRRTPSPLGRPKGRLYIRQPPMGFGAHDTLIRSYGVGFSYLLFMVLCHSSAIVWIALEPYASHGRGLDAIPAPQQV